MLKKLKKKNAKKGRLLYRIRSKSFLGDEMTREFLPRLISWNMTFRCNLHCPHCYIDARESPTRDELSTEEGKMLIDQIVEVSKPILILSGGERLLRDLSLIHI